MSAHDMNTLEATRSTFTANGVKGAKMFAIDQQGPPKHRLCISIKKKLMLYEYAGGQFSYLKARSL
jgi:hypothetical protein